MGKGAGPPSPEDRPGIGLPAVTGDAPERYRSTATLFAVVCLPFGAGYFLSYLYRSINAVIGPRLAAEFGLGAGDLGLLTAVYFLGFGLFQLPLGVLLDRYGPRRVQFALLLAAATGAVLFAAAPSPGLLIAGRTLIGVGFAGGLMASFKAVTLWFPRRRWPLVNGIVMSLGGLGTMAATTPVEMALDWASWRTVFHVLAAVTAAVSVFILLAVPRHESERGGRADSLREALAGLGLIFRDRVFWRLAPISVTAMGAGLAIQGLWAGPWLYDVAGLAPEGVAWHLLILNLALTLGMLATGFVAAGFDRLGIGAIGVVAASAVALLVPLGLLILQVDPRGYWVWALFGFVSNFAIIVYPAISAHFTVEYAGRAMTGLNLLLFLGAFAIQYLIGAVIDLWPPDPSGGYHPDGYRVAFGFVALLIVLSLGWLAVPGGALRRSPPRR